MEIWLLVIILLVLAIIFLVASLFTKNDSDLEDLMNDNLIQVSQELNKIKNRLTELESTVYQQDSTMNYNSYQDKIEEEQEAQAELNSFEQQVDENPDIVSEQSRNSVIQMYSQGYTLQEITDEVGLDAFTIQSIVDDYIENR